MSRTKTFDATGIAPGGVLYAGDLNALQDHYADLVNLAQTVGVGVLQVGESGLQIIRFGVGEARVTGALRTDGILRGLGGLYGGQFTTAQRDAIAAGSRPTGLTIFNTTTNRYETNSGTDAAPSWTGIAQGITNADIAAGAAIAKSKLAALGIVDADVAAGAAIAKSKLASLGIVDADVAAGAAIARSKLNFGSGLVDADIAAAAAIAKTKLAALNIGNADVAAGAGILESKLSLTSHPLNRVVFLTSGSASPFVASAGTRALLVICKAGGGAGGGNAATGAGSLGAGGGGGEGATAMKWITANIGSHVFAVGAGGTGGAGSTGNGGGDTTFQDSAAAVVCRAKAGIGGVVGTPAWPALGGLGGVGGGVAGTGDLQFGGAPGQPGLTFGSAAGQFMGGAGGGTGGGGAVSNTATGLAAAANSGAGGGGSASGISSPALAGGAGSSGYIIVYEFV